MDWSNWETNKQLNKGLTDNQNDFKIIMEEDTTIFSLTDINVINSIHNIQNKILYILLQNTILLRYDPMSYIKEEITYYNNSTLYNSNVLDNVVIIPLVPPCTKYNIYEYHDLIKHMNIKKSDKILVYYDKFNNFYNTLITMFDMSIDKYDDIKDDNNNKYDVWYCSHIDKYSQNSCNWYMYRVTWYINQLIYISKYCKNNARCAFTFDFRFLNIKIYKEIIALFSCFMKVTLYNGNLMIFDKCVIIGTELDLNKLQKWCKTVKILDEYKEGLINKDTFCLNTKPIIMSINIKINDDLDKSINDVLEKYNKYKNNILKMIYVDSMKYDDYNQCIIDILNQSCVNLQKHILKYPYEINSYYSDTMKHCAVKISDNNKIYFHISDMKDANKLYLSNEQLYNIIEPSDMKKIARIIKKNCKKKTIIDMTSFSGLYSIAFSKIYKNVIAINSDYNNHKILNSNIDIYKTTNIKSVHNDCIKFISENRLIAKLLFFDLTKYNIMRENNKVVIFSDYTIDKLIKILFEYCRRLHVFILTNNKNNIATHYTEHIINNNYLLYFTNV